MVPKSSGESRPAARTPETFVESFEKGLKVITAFDADHRALTLSEVAERTEMTRAAARRLLLTLVALGYAHHDGKRFTLTSRVMQLGHAYLGSSQVAELAKPVLAHISQLLGESSSVAVLDGTDIVYVARNQTTRIMRADLGVGTRLPAVATSMGRVLLAHDDRRVELIARSPLVKHTERTVVNKAKLNQLLDDVYAQGFALVDQELEEGLRSIAVPIVDRSNRVIAALNVSGQANRVTLEEMKRRFLPVLRAAAQSLRIE